MSDVPSALRFDPNRPISAVSASDSPLVRTIEAANKHPAGHSAALLPCLSDHALQYRQTCRRGGRKELKGLITRWLGIGARLARSIQNWLLCGLVTSIVTAVQA